MESDQLMLSNANNYCMKVFLWRLECFKISTRSTSTVEVQSPHGLQFSAPTFPSSLLLVLPTYASAGTSISVLVYISSLDGPSVLSVLLQLRSAGLFQP